MMKNSIYKLTFLALLFVTISACGDGGEPEPEGPTAQELTFENLSGQWGLPSTGGIVVDGVDRTLNYVGFSLSFTDGGYTTTNAGTLFQASGTWSWANETTTNLISLDDGKDIRITGLSTSQLVFTFTKLDGGVRAGIAGEYVVSVNK